MSDAPLRPIRWRVSTVKHRKPNILIGGLLIQGKSVACIQLASLESRKSHLPFAPLACLYHLFGRQPSERQRWIKNIRVLRHGLLQDPANMRLRFPAHAYCPILPPLMPPAPATSPIDASRRSVPRTSTACLAALLLWVAVCCTQQGGVLPYGPNYGGRIPVQIPDALAPYSDITRPGCAAYHTQGQRQKLEPISKYRSDCRLPLVKQAC
uniref:Uncharacterized protein n=1 Tax=Spironucleus salmonicida TaxID=348837 RepID=V6LMP1_9EUKA|eukprot:EST45895.1 Hypothetical protein SS50377_14140 [Spironucleus salmonicida]